MTKEDAKKVYEELFSNDSEKAKAFDKIAEKYYYSNFGSTSKADFDVLMFSLYIEQILEKGTEKFSSYSDYTLSKQLGITQSKVSNLKVKKELLYPYDKFDWKKSFLQVSRNAIFEDNKIKVFIPDRNLYIELKNAIETMGGYTEVQLTSNLLQVRLAFFLDLLLAISKEEDREKIRRELRKIVKANDQDEKLYENENVGKALLKKTPEIIIGLIGECIPVFGGAVKVIAENIYDVLKSK